MGSVPVGRSNERQSPKVGNWHASDAWRYSPESSGETYELVSTPPVGLTRGLHPTEETMNNGRIHALSDAEASALQKCRLIVEAFRTIDHKIPASYIAAFLAVALQPGKGPTAYAQVLDTIQPIASRMLLEIGPKARHKSTPLGLVDKDVSAHSLRDHEYFLTPRGRKLMADLIGILNDASLIKSAPTDASLQVAEYSVNQPVAAREKPAKSFTAAPELIGICPQSPDVEQRVAFEYQRFKDIPVPTERASRSSKYDWDVLGLNESFFVPRAKPDTFNTLTSTRNKRERLRSGDEAKKFVARKFVLDGVEGVMVWRVA